MWTNNLTDRAAQPAVRIADTIRQQSKHRLQADYAANFGLKKGTMHFLPLANKLSTVSSR